METNIPSEEPVYKQKRKLPDWVLGLLGLVGGIVAGCLVMALPWWMVTKTF